MTRFRKLVHARIGIRGRRAAAVVALCLAHGSAAANLLVNGSFEAPVVTTGFYQNYGAGSPLITGWTVVGVDSAVVSGTFVQNGITFNAADGSQWLDLAGVTSNSMLSGVTQTVATVAGASYALSFYVGGTSDGSIFFPATIDLSIDGSPRTSFANAAAPRNSVDWQLFTVGFVAAAPTTALAFYNGSGPGNFFNGLDNVSLTPVAVTTPVPEPAEWALITLGLAFVAARRRRASARASGAGGA